MRRMLACTLIGVAIFTTMPSMAYATDLIPPAERIKTDRPRVLLRPAATPLAVSLGQLEAIPRDADFHAMLAQLKGHRSAAAQAMVYLLTGEEAAAEKAIARMRAYEFPGQVDTFHIYFHLLEFGLAYDWLYNYPGFTREIKAEVRAKVLPLARFGFKQTNDHVFHNYIWMSAGGTAIWALATAGEDDQADQLFAQISQRLNRGLFPAMEYLDGLPCEPMGYWALYDFSPAVLAVLAAQSAFETDLVGAVKRDHHDWLDRHFDNLVQSTLPDMRYIPWGDLQGGPNGGVTYEMAGVIDAATWALKSPQGAYFSRWLAGRRGLRRFYGDTAVFYMLYTRNLATQPAVPRAAFLAGNAQSGHFIARGGWEDADTVVSLRSTDHFGDHNHYDQGSFMIYRNGLLAVDPPVYNHIRGPQQQTEHHNTLLLGGSPQRPARGQWFKTVEDFQKNLEAGAKLETGDVLFGKDAGTWAAAACQFAQAYEPEVVERCVRQLLFVRPGIVVVVDHLSAPAGRDLPEVQWLLQVPQPPTIEGAVLSASNGTSWLRCRSVLPGATVPGVTATSVNTHCAAFSYPGAKRLTLVHLIEVGDGRPPDAAAAITAEQVGAAVEVAVNGRTFTFAAETPFDITVKR